MRRRPMERLHSRGRCVCDRSSIPEIPWSTRKTRGQVTRPGTRAPAHMQPSCAHTTLMQTTWLGMAELRGFLNRRRRPIPRAEYAA